MARPKTKRVTKTKRTRLAGQSVRVSRPTSPSLADRLNVDFNDRRSVLNLLLGALVVVVLGVLLFNYFAKNNPSQPNLGPAQQTENTQTKISDVSKNNLPGKYTVKEGDTLFAIAQKYYDDGYKYSELVKANKLADENKIEVGQVLDIPKLEAGNALALASPSPAAGSESEVPGSNMPAANPDQGTGGAINQTMWGERINGDTYTVVEGDWLSKISGRAYGDIMAFTKIAQANNIANPDLIEPGTVLKIPR